MKIKNHRLFDDQDQQVRFVRSPNSSGKLSAHEYLVIHFTAGRSMESSENWLTNPDARASAHLIIGRDGSVVQLVPFDTKAWHAGVSQWAGRNGLNSYSIGIELDNAGKLKRQGDKWVAWFGQAIPDEEVVVATHKHETEEAGWHAFTQPQLETAMEVSSALVKKYDLLEVIGHDDIAPSRKTDPGPAFPMASFSAHVTGRGEDESDSTYKTTTVLNIRTGPGTSYEKLIATGLPKGTEVIVMEEVGNWRFVDVLATVGGEMDLQGWVHGRYLTRS
jgi:N-acetylmuramoyl-L-alanine amidase